MTLPNMLTITRFPSAILFFAIYVGGGRGGPCEGWLPLPALFGILLAICFVSELSDLLDGYLARRRNEVSNLGKILDPQADSTFHLSCFFAFTSPAFGGWVPLWMVIILFYREVLVSVIRKLGTAKGIYVQARGIGKIKSLAQAMVISLLVGIAFVKSLLVPEDASFHDLDMAGIGISLMWVAVGITLYSAVDYTWANRHLFRTVDERPGGGAAAEAPGETP